MPHAQVYFLRRSKELLYRIGTKKDLPMVKSRIPERVFTEVARGIFVLDAEYSPDRDPLVSGGYALIAETEDDLAELREIVDYEVHPCEWVTQIGKDTGYLSCLFLTNDDFGIIAYMPCAIAPAAILRDLEE